jgi:hypothetical protein
MESRAPRQTPDIVEVAIPLAVVRALRPAAARRDTTVPRLISDLVEVVSRDNLVSAVLDTPDDDQSNA